MVDRESNTPQRPVRRSLLSEFAAYLMDNKKWWMIPIVIMVLFLLIVLIFAGSPVAPLIYALF